MPKTRAESKYFATARRMDEALISLLGKKDFPYITVKEICAEAGVNRSTFYLHYETVGDLLSESVQYIMSEFVASMPHGTEEFLEKLPTRPLEELYLITPEYLTPYLNYIKEHRRVFRATVEQAAALRMADAYAALTRHVFEPILCRFSVAPEDRRYLMSFYIHGLMAVIDEWLKDDCRDSVGHVTEIMRRCVGGKNGGYPDPRVR